VARRLSSDITSDELPIETRTVVQPSDRLLRGFAMEVREEQTVRDDADPDIGVRGDAS